MTEEACFLKASYLQISESYHYSGAINGRVILFFQNPSPRYTHTYPSSGLLYPFPHGLGIVLLITR